MRPYLLIVSACLLACVLHSCSKESKEHYTGRMKGPWIATGGDHGLQDIYYDQFFRFEIEVLNSNEIVGLTGSTLKYQSTNRKEHTVVFSGGSSGRYGNSSETLVYNYGNNTITDNFKGNGASSFSYYSFDVHITAEPLYTVDAAPSENLTKLNGIRMLSGFVYDTLAPRSPHDTLIPFSSEVSFTVVNGSTIRVKADHRYYDDTLYYRATEGNDLIFQSYHTKSERTTLTFNYINNTTVYEEWSSTQMSTTHYKLQ